MNEDLFPTMSDNLLNECVVIWYEKNKGKNQTHSLQFFDKAKAKIELEKQECRFYLLPVVGWLEQKNNALLIIKKKTEHLPDGRSEAIKKHHSTVSKALNKFKKATTYEFLTHCWLQAEIMGTIGKMFGDCKPGASNEKSLLSYNVQLEILRGYARQHKPKLETALEFSTTIRNTSLQS